MSDRFPERSATENFSDLMTWMIAVNIQEVPTADFWSVCPTRVPVARFRALNSSRISYSSALGRESRLGIVVTTRHLRAVSPSQSTPLPCDPSRLNRRRLTPVWTRLSGYCISLTWAVLPPLDPSADPARGVTISPGRQNDKNRKNRPGAGRWQPDEDRAGMEPGPKEHRSGSHLDFTEK